MERPRAKPFHVVIVGGGTAGWMTAAYIRHLLNASVKVTVIESAHVGRIGVGEATFSTIRLFFERLGIAEEEWMPACGGTYKLAIKFVDWNRQRKPFYHPFQRYAQVDGYNLAEWWLKIRPGDEPVDRACFVVPKLCEKKRSPRHFDGLSFCDSYERQRRCDAGEPTSLDKLQWQYPYAYHFDAQRIADFLMHRATGRGVHHIRDDVVGVEHGADGSLATVRTAERGSVDGDLFIDCTGFRGLLINKAMKEPFRPFSSSLLCDAAVATQVRSDGAVEDINPYTTATALSSGWVWDIPLFGRKGVGYVYSKAFLRPEEAERELARYLGARTAGCRMTHIAMRVGRCERSWVKNCVAIGLSSGFVEPLESTGIFFIQHGIEELVRHFPGSERDDAAVSEYNRRVAECIDGVRDFLTLHYVASSRVDTPFWLATKKDIRQSDDLKARLEGWSRRLPNERTIFPHYHGFEDYSYSVMLMGLGGGPSTNLPVLDRMKDSGARAAFKEVEARADRLVETLPSHFEYLRRLPNKGVEPGAVNGALQ